METYEAIKNSLVRLFKRQYPDFDIYCEEIARTREEAEHLFDSDNFVFVDIIPTGNKTLDAYHTERTLMVDAAIHTSGEQNSEYRLMSQELDGIIRPVFRFDDRAVTVPDISFRVVDHVLHCTFTLQFTDSADEPIPLPAMSELSIENKP